MFKKICVLFLSAVLVCTAFATVSSAAGSCKVSVEYAVEGETLSVTVTYSDFNDNDGVVGVSGNMYFDSTVLEFKEVKADLPEKWGDQGENWSKLYSEGNVLMALVFSSGEVGHGTTDPVSCTVEFKILKTGVDTAIEVKNSEITESGALEIINAPNTSLTVSISESGEVSGDVSEEEISLPDESEDASVPEESEENESTSDESEKAESNVSVSDNSTEVSADEKDNGGNWWIWLVIVIAVVAVAAVVAVVVVKKKDK